MKPPGNLLCLLLGVLAASLAPARASEVPSLSLDDETVERLGITTTNLEVVSRPSQLQAYGEVLDPASLLSQARNLKLLALQSEQAKRVTERAAKLDQAGQLVPVRSVEDARLQQATLELQTQAAVEDLRLSWGLAADSPKLETLVGRITRGEAGIVRLSFPLGTRLPTLPGEALVWPTGNPASRVKVEELWAATMASPQRAPGCYAVVSAPRADYPVGLGVSASLILAAESQPMLHIPANAVVYQFGGAWIYQRAEAGTFSRHLIHVGLPAPDGWFIPAKDLNQREPVVELGAQALLAHEILSQAGEPEDEE